MLPDPKGDASGDWVKKILQPPLRMPIPFDLYSNAAVRSVCGSYLLLVAVDNVPSCVCNVPSDKMHVKLN